MTQEKVEGRAVPEEPVLFKEPVKKASKGFSIFICSLIVIGVFYSLSSDSKITGTGTLKAQKYTKLQTAVAGTLKEMIAKKGNVVKAGEVLARFDNPELIKDLSLKRKSLEMSEEELAGFQQREVFLRKKNERAAVLFENGVIGKSDFEKVSLELDEFQKNVSLQVKKKEALQEEVKYFEGEISKLDLKAPFEGIILSDPSERVTNYFKQEDDVFEIGDAASLYVEMPVRENQVEKIHIGSRADIQFDAVSSQKYSGLVVGIGVKTNQEVEKVFKVKHVVVCEIKLKEDTAGLRYGMQARVIIRSSAVGMQGWRNKIFPKGESNFDGAFKS